MAIITCRLGSDGKLSPETFEFEIGDIIQPAVDEPTNLFKVNTPFTLGSISAQPGIQAVNIPADHVTHIPHEHPLPVIITPPPAQGGAIKVIVFGN